MADDCDEYGDGDFEVDAPATPLARQPKAVDAVDTAGISAPLASAGRPTCRGESTDVKTLALDLEPRSNASDEGDSSARVDSPEFKDILPSPPLHLVSNSYDEATILKHCFRRDECIAPGGCPDGTMRRRGIAPLKMDDVRDDPACIAAKIAAKRVATWNARMKKAKMKAVEDDALKQQVKREWRRCGMTSSRPMDRHERLAETTAAMRCLRMRKAQEHTMAVRNRWYHRKAALGLTTHELRGSDTDRAMAFLNHKRNDDKSKRKSAQASRNHLESELQRIVAEAKVARERACHYEHHVKGSFWLKRSLVGPKDGCKPTTCHVVPKDCPASPIASGIVIVDGVGENAALDDNQLNSFATNPTPPVQDEAVERSAEGPLSTQENPPPSQSSGLHIMLSPVQVESVNCSHSSKDANAGNPTEGPARGLEPEPALANLGSPRDTDPAKPHHSSPRLVLGTMAKLDRRRPADVT